MANVESTENQPSASSRSFFGRLVSGDFGLARTYWGFGVLVGLVVNLALRAVTSNGVIAVVTLVYTAYEIPVLIGVWRASNKYRGLKLWAVFAKIAVVWGCILLLLGLLGAFVLLAKA